MYPAMVWACTVIKAGGGVWSLANYLHVLVGAGLSEAVGYFQAPGFLEAFETLGRFPKLSEMLKSCSALRGGGRGLPTEGWDSRPLDLEAAELGPKAPAGPCDLVVF